MISQTSSAQMLTALPSQWMEFVRVETFGRMSLYAAKLNLPPHGVVFDD